MTVHFAELYRSTGFARLAHVQSSPPNDMQRARPIDSWILEGLMTTVAAEPADASMQLRLNIAPMGPIVDRRCEQFTLRPFKTSTTYLNLKAAGTGVFHVTDDALMIARAAIGTLSLGTSVSVQRAKRVAGLILSETCRYYELRVTKVDDRCERTWIEAQVIAKGKLRDFFGFNRARHAVVEAAILATRIFLTGPQPALAELARLQTIVDKTGSGREQAAMAELRDFVESQGDAKSNRHQE